MQSRGVVVPQVFKINLLKSSQKINVAILALKVGERIEVLLYLLFETNIELSDRTYASTWETIIMVNEEDKVVFVIYL